MEYLTQKSNRFLRALGWFFGISFFLAALGTISYPPLALVFALIGLVLLPPGHRLIEKIGRFRLTTKMKSVLVALLLICASPLANHYTEINKQNLSQSASIVEREETATREQQRKDSLAKDSSPIAIIRAINLVHSGKNQPALYELNQLIRQDSTNADLIYNRAICYSRMGKVREAVTDCMAAIQLGNKEAQKLHDKINPLLKRVSYYVTQCCDGSISSATGRGACSHHGGVCSWNHPVYEEYRKYE